MCIRDSLKRYSQYFTKLELKNVVNFCSCHEPFARIFLKAGGFIAFIVVIDVNQEVYIAQPFIRTKCTSSSFHRIDYYVQLIGFFCVSAKTDT